MKLQLLLKTIFQTTTETVGIRILKRGIGIEPLGGFNSKAGIAQLVERLFRNQKVAGSNPVSGSKSITILAINAKK